MNNEPAADRIPHPLASLLKYQEAFEFAPDCQLLTDSRGVILTANFASTHTFGCPREFLVGKPLGLFFTDGHRSQFYLTLSYLGKAGTARAFEARLTQGKEDPRDVQVMARAAEPGRGPAGDVTLHWLIRDITEWKQAEATRAELLHRLVTAQEEERKRVARDLHDGLGQTVTALALGLHAVRRAGPLPPEALARLDVVQRLASVLSEQMHELAVRLRPLALDAVGLHEALHQRLVEWAPHTGVAIDYHTYGIQAERLPPEVETTIYRVIQEALTNVAKHARASHVSVVLGRHGDEVTVAVEDNGVGFDPEAVGADGKSPLGLLGMRERVAMLGGTLEIESFPDGGTSVLAHIPLHGGPSEPTEMGRQNPR